MGADRVVVASRDCVFRLELTFSQYMGLWDAEPLSFSNTFRDLAERIGCVND